MGDATRRPHTEGVKVKRGSMMKLKLIAIVALLASSLGGCVYVPYDHYGYGYNRPYYGYQDGHRYYRGDGYYNRYHDHGD